MTERVVCKKKGRGLLLSFVYCLIKKIKTSQRQILKNKTNIKSKIKNQKTKNKKQKTKNKK